MFLASLYTDLHLFYALEYIPKQQPILRLASVLFWLFFERRRRSAVGVASAGQYQICNISFLSAITFVFTLPMLLLLDSHQCKNTTVGGGYGTAHNSVDDSITRMMEITRKYPPSYIHGVACDNGSSCLLDRLSRLEGGIWVVEINEAAENKRQ